MYTCMGVLKIMQIGLTKTSIFLSEAPLYFQPFHVPNIVTEVCTVPHAGLVREVAG